MNKIKQIIEEETKKLIKESQKNSYQGRTIKKDVINMINEEVKHVLQEGLLEDPIEQAGSITLSMLDSRGFRTPGFVEALVASIKMEAEKSKTTPNEFMESELLKFRRGLDDLADRIAGRIRTYFPVGYQAQAQRQDGSVETRDIPFPIAEEKGS